MTGWAPLAGKVVLDLTRNVAGPFATAILADLGARVIKIEHPGQGDDTRHWGPPFVDGTGAMFLQLNRNKESLCLDLKDAAARDVLASLVKRSDVLVESFRPGALDRMGYGTDWAHDFNPELIYASITGYGATGPLRETPGYDPLIQAYAGLMSITGEADRPAVRVGFSVVDQGTGMWCALAILAALGEERTERRHIVTSLYETAVSWAMLPLATYLAGGKVPTRYGSGTSTIVPYRAYPAKDGEVVIAAGNDRLFKRLCQALDHPEWAAKPDFLTNPDRVRNRNEIDRLIEDAVTQLSAAELISLLTQVGVPCSPVRTLDCIHEDEQVAALGLLCDTGSHDGGIPIVQMPFVADGTRPAVSRHAPDLGEHSRTILAELGYGENEIELILNQSSRRNVHS